MSPPPDPRQCPLCGRPNESGMARGKGSCWCFRTPVPAEVLEKLPGAARDRACVCQTCATGVRDTRGIFARLNEILRGH